MAIEKPGDSRVNQPDCRDRFLLLLPEACLLFAPPDLAAGALFRLPLLFGALCLPVFLAGALALAALGCGALDRVVLTVGVLRDCTTAFDRGALGRVVLTVGALRDLTLVFGWGALRWAVFTGAVFPVTAVFCLLLCAGALA
jgi:hypothetical protein